MKSVIYIRTSTEDQNPENQLRDCLSVNPCEDYILIEDKQSAWKDKDRPGFNEIEKLVKQSQITHLIVWDLDRVYRNRIKLKSFLEYLKIYKIVLLSYRQSWLNDLQKIPSPWNEIVYENMINIMGWLAEDESKKKSDRVKIAQRKKDGVTYSYKGNKWGRKSLSSQKYNKIISLKDLPMRKIASEANCSIGVVHKVLKEFEAQKEDLKPSSEKV